MFASPLLLSTRPAVTVDLAGWTVAAHYGNPAVEVTAIHASCGVIDHSVRGLIEVRGEDRGQWLDRIVSNDTAGLEPGRHLRALLLTVKGRIACDLRVHALADRLLLVTAFDTADRLLAELRRFVLYGDRVTVADARADSCQVAVHGPGSAALLTDVTGIATADLSPGRLRCGGRLVIARSDAFGLPGYDLTAPADMGHELWLALAEQAQPFGWRAAEILRLEAGRPRWGAELTPEVLPLEAELEEALCHTKGCYPGQEVVARMRDRGHPNRLLRALSVDGEQAPVRDAVVTLPGGGKPVGAITSAAVSPTLGPRALAYLRTAQAEPGTQLEVALPDGTARCVVALPGR